MRFERDILSLEASLEQALVVGGEIASRSYTPTTHQLLLASAVYSQPALEAMGDHPTQSVAMEGILATIKEKARNWGNKISGFVKNTLKGLVGSVQSLISKVTGKFEKADPVLSNASGQRGMRSDLPPARKVIACLTAAVAAIGLISACVAGAPALAAGGAAAAKVITTLGTKAAAIVWPYGRIVVKKAKDNKRLTFAIAGVATAAGGTLATLASLGYTEEFKTSAENGFKSIGSKFSAVWPSFLNAVKVGAGKVWQSISGSGKAFAVGYGDHYYQNPDINSSQAKRHLKGLAAGTVMGGFAMISSVLVGVYHLVKTVIMGALKLVGSVLTKLASYGRNISNNIKAQRSGAYV